MPFHLSVAMNLGGDLRQTEAQSKVLTLTSCVAMGELVTSLRLWILVCRAGQTTLTVGSILHSGW